MTDRQSYELIQLLSTHCVANVQNGLIHTLAIWLEEHVQGDSVERRKREAFSAFYGLVRDVIARRQYGRNRWPKTQALPSPHNEIKVIETLSDRLLQHMKSLSFENGLKFLAELWGGWILACPIEIIRQSPEFAGESNSESTESELVESMLRYLDVVYGNM